jgi:alanine-glyoxylate transaminase/serine-glyoxylate transaminase/serine-pyruvate transaminase
MDHPVIDHRSAEFAKLGTEVIEGLRGVFQTTSPVVMYPASGTGAWEAAIVNTLSPGDRVLLFETGHFSQLWRQVAEKFGLQVEYIPGNWRRGASAAELEARLAHCQGRPCGSQRDVHRRDEPHPRSSPGNESGASSRVVDGGHDFFARFH